MKRLDIFKCSKCGNIVEVMHVGGGQLVCCGEPMTALVENTSDGAKEKHVPVFADGKVKVGSVAHPMEPDHYIEWIEITDGSGCVCTKFLSPGEAPEVETCECGGKIAREYCNKHGLWKGEK